MKAAVVELKKVCRQRTMVAWKEWRASMEAHRGASLQVRPDPLPEVPFGPLPTYIG